MKVNIYDRFYNFIMYTPVLFDHHDNSCNDTI